MRTLDQIYSPDNQPCPFKSEPLAEAWRQGAQSSPEDSNPFAVGAGIAIGDWPKLTAWQIGREGVDDEERDLRGHALLVRRMSQAKLLRRGKFCNVDLAGVPLSRPWTNEISAWMEVLQGIAGEE